MSKDLPLQLLDKCIGQNVWILMKNNKEFIGELKGFDPYINVILDNVKE
jgi:U6 snRNA-associated Sm-like protein LSm5